MNKSDISAGCQTVPAGMKWVAVDWGTSNLRAYAIDAENSVLAELSSDKGMNMLTRDQFESALLELLEPWLDDARILQVFACGMVGARQGWVEAEYQMVPCPPVVNSILTQAPTSDPRIRVSILPGIAQMDPPDVMRGEETQLAGLLMQNPGFTGPACLPGTHSKWVQMVDGIIVSFKTFMTGELFSLISSQSVLRHCLSDSGLEMDIFLEAALTGYNDPDVVLRDLFSLRAASILKDANPDTARARLSGLLIGQEIAFAKQFWSERPPIIIGSPKFAGLYARVLKEFSIDATILNSQEATILGLTVVANKEASNIYVE